MPSIKSYTFKIPCDRTEAVTGDVIVLKHGGTDSLTPIVSIYDASGWSKVTVASWEGIPTVIYDEIGSTRYAVVSFSSYGILTNPKATYIKA